MTLHLPSRRVLIAAGALVLGALVALYWHALVSFLLAAAGLRLVWLLKRGRRSVSAARRGSALTRWAEAFALLSGARSLRRGIAPRHVDELHAAKLETERARTDELRSRVEHRRRTRGEQEAAERRAYIRGAADAEGFRQS